jgi:hypothetical protein
MVENRLRWGPLISAIAAAALGASVFLPWYGLSLTATGATSAQQTLDGVAQQYGNAAFQIQAKTVGAGFSAYAGHQLATLSAHQLLKDISVVLLIFAAIAMVAALLRLAAASEPMQANGPLVLVGIGATLCVLFRMVDRPAPTEGIFSLSLSWGIWLALGSSVAILVGGLWPTQASRTADSLEQYSGWTPEA